jgi:hypothetical protein
MKGSGILSDQVKQIETTEIPYKNTQIPVRYKKKGDLYFLFTPSGDDFGLRVYDDEEKLKADAIYNFTSSPKKYKNQLGEFYKKTLKRATDIEALMDFINEKHRKEVKHQADVKSNISKVSHIGEAEVKNEDDVEEIKIENENDEVKLTRKDLKLLTNIYNELNNAIIAVNKKVDVSKKKSKEEPESMTELVERFGNDKLLQLQVIDTNPLALSVTSLSLIDGSLNEKEIGQIIDDQYEIYQMIKDGKSKKEIIDKIVELTRKTNQLNIQKKTATFASTKDVVRKIKSVKV